MKICSVTLCGNSQNDVGDAIRSIVDYVDVVCFINTGCTDNSSKIAQDIAGEKFVEKHYQWKNDFADARNSFFKFAKECECDYFIIVDSDERIIFNDNITNKTLKQLIETEGLEGYSFRYASRGGNFSYLKEKILKTNISDTLRYTQKTHECFPMYSLKTKVFEFGEFWELGKSKEKLIKKFERDIEILTTELLEKPNDERSTFYMARSYHDLWGQTGNNEYAEQAIQWYDKRKVLSGYYDERYMSQLYTSRIKLQLGREKYSESDVIVSFLECSKYNSQRLEHLEWVIEHYQHKKEWETAYMLTSYGVDKKYNNYLFNEPQIYEWKIYDLHGMSCFYTGRKVEMKECGKILQTLVDKKKIPEQHLQRINSNIKFYLT
jgi:hypothetical protein